MKHIIPFKAPDLHAVNSLRELRQARREAAEFSKHDQVRTDALGIVEGCRSWLDRAVFLNDSSEDHAQHDPHLVVLDKSPVPVGNGETSWYGEMSGEVRLDHDSGTLKSADVQLDDSKFGYRKAGRRETFTQFDQGVHTKVVLDHAKNVLTWEY